MFLRGVLGGGRYLWSDIPSGGGVGFSGVGLQRGVSIPQGVGMWGGILRDRYSGG